MLLQNGAELERAHPPQGGDGFVGAHDDEAISGRYGGAVSPLVPARRDVLIAAGLAVAGVAEEALLVADGSAARAAGVVVLGGALAWRRSLPLLPVAVAALVLLLESWLAGYFEASPAIPLLGLVVALYSAGRYAGGVLALAGAGLAAVVLAATRVGFDPGVRRAGDAILTFAAVAMPLLIGRWVQGQMRLQDELQAKAARLERERERNARLAAEEERMRIAGDLQEAIAGGLADIVRQAGELRGRLAAADHAGARELLASIAGTAREALADVRRVLGILRRDGEVRRLDPPAAAPTAAVARPHAAGSNLPPDGRAAGAPARSAGEPGSSDRRARSADEPGSSDRPAGVVRWPRDPIVVATLLAVAETELIITAPGGDPALAALTGALVVAPLVARRRAPVLAGLGVLAGVVLQSALLDPGSIPASSIATLICANFAIGAYADRRFSVAGLALMAIGGGVHAAVVHPGSVAQAVLGGAAVPWTVGRILRGQRRLTGEVREKATQMERSRASDARAAAGAERMRVARELHDAVAHNISVIAIQAGGADGIVERDPERAAQCAALIETVSREAIVELGRLAGDPALGDDRPAGLARVDALAERAREGGLPVEVAIEGEPRPLPAGLDLAAFRIVQEALANASKHAGDARARVVVRYEPRAVELEIADDGHGVNGHAPPGDGSGHGLVGMRERAALYGGTLQAGRRDEGGFEVRARLPL
jgi:signal transduction histidine kinase